MERALALTPAAIISDAKVCLDSCNVIGSSFAFVQSVSARAASDESSKGVPAVRPKNSPSLRPKVRADFYSAAGAFEFRRTFHEVEHFTASNGVVRVDLNKGHFHSFGDC